MKNIYCIIGKSGSGKTTVTELLEKQGLKSVCSYTTRKPRYVGETGHIFVTDDEYDKIGFMCAETVFDGNRYGVPSSMVDDCDLYVIDVAGIEYLKEHYHGAKNIKAIGLVVDEETLIMRMRKRGDSEERISARIEHDREKFKGMYDICDVLMPAGGTVEETMECIRHYIFKTESAS